ncbi:MAG TPA: hypothetical protein VGJ26_01575 [Pirellulales bacterium]|jgi:hypothetical protein
MFAHLLRSVSCFTPHNFQAWMYTFQISLHARSDEVTAGGELLRAGSDYPTLCVPNCALLATFPYSFETVAAELASLGRLYIEPDGSFVWVSSKADLQWQVDGVLYDRDERLLFVDLKGSCPTEEFDRILTACGWPATPVMMQLTHEAVFVDEETFRELASALP